jgi:glycosyltransferase involved in cell wall biosynthesis
MLTIVVANYNHARFLPDCLAAIVAQTRAPDEVLVIDDGSTDDSLEVISSFAPRLPGFRLIRHEVNCGVVATLNEGLREAAGTHVLFAAADDWIEAELVELSMRMVEQFPRAGVFSALTRLAAETGRVTGPFRTTVPLRQPGYVGPDEVARLLTRDDSWFNGNTTIVNRAAALEAGGYRPELKSLTDTFLNVALALRHGACFIPRFLAVWRRMKAGYAAVTVADPAAMLETLDTAERLMRAPGQTLYRPDYVARWAARWRFTAARAVLSSSSPASPEWLAAILPRGRHRLAPAIQQLARIPFAGNPLAIALLFILLRSRDSGAVLRRRLEWMFRARRLERRAS